MNYWLLLLTFISVNLDFFFMLIFLLKKHKVYQVLVGYLLGTVVLLILSYAMGQVLEMIFPEWAVGILGFLPIYMALRDEDDEAEDESEDKAKSSSILSVMVIYMSVCAGCNLSIFLPIVVGMSLMHFITALVFVSILTVIVVYLIKAISQIHIVTEAIEQYGEIIMKIIYVAVGLYVFWDSGLITHIMTLF